MEKFLEDKMWQYLSDEKISKLSDIKQQSIYRRKINKTVKFIINPLYMFALRQGFDDTNFLKEATVHGMVEELKAFYEGRGIDREGRIKVLLEGRKK